MQTYRPIQKEIVSAYQDLLFLQMAAIKYIYMLVQLSVSIVLTTAQAPGDGANLCLSAQFAKDPYPPQFATNVVPLMDSYDYQTLLTSPPPGMGTWRGVNVDGDSHYVSSRRTLECVPACMHGCTYLARWFRDRLYF